MRRKDEVSVFVMIGINKILLFVCLSVEMIAFWHLPTCTICNVSCQPDMPILVQPALLIAYTTSEKCHIIPA